MKPLIPILVVATTSLAVASVQFAQQASVQRKRADAEMQLRQKQALRVAELERNQARLERELAIAMAREPQATLTPAQPVSAAASRPTPSAPPSGAGLYAAAETGSANTPPPPGFQPRNPFDSPAGRNFMRTRAKAQIRRMYGDAGEALGLSADKGQQLLDLLAQQQTRNMGGVRDKIPQGQTFQQYFQEQQKRNNDEILALIGQDKAAEWEAYQKSLPQRAMLGAVGDQLEQAGVPMTESQRTQMLAAIMEESQRLPRPAVSQGLPPEEMMAQMNQWQTEYDKALLERAKQVLNTDQYNAYKDYHDWQTEMRNSLPRGPNGLPAGVVVRSVASGGSAGVVVGGGPMVNFTTAVPAPALPQPAQPPPRN